MDGISTTIKNQLSFNNMLETQLALLATSITSAVDNVYVATMRGGKTTRDPPYLNHDSREQANQMVEELPRDDDTEKVHEGKTAPHELYNTRVLQFPMKIKKPTTDE
jgi:hypothetical protein